MDNKKTRPAQSAAKHVPLKPARKNSWSFLWFFLVLFLAAGILGAGLLFRIIPLDEETYTKLEPLLVKTEEVFKGASEGLGPLFEKMKTGKAPEEETAGGKPKTNFSLVDLDDNKKNALPSPSPGNILGPSAIASAAPVQSAQGTAGGSKPAVTGGESTGASKIYGKLAKLYGGMKPEEAVAVFNNLEDEQVINILSRMEEEAAGRVLATLEPKRAARLTQAMIKRK